MNAKVTECARAARRLDRVMDEWCGAVVGMHDASEWCGTVDAMHHTSKGCLAGNKHISASLYLYHQSGYALVNFPISTCVYAADTGKKLEETGHGGVLLHTLPVDVHK